MNTLIVGYSTRSIAESAVAGGYRVVTLDYFGDSDQRQQVENLSLMRDLGLDYSALALLEAGRSLDYQEVVYISSLENQPQVVDELARGRVLHGNLPSVLREVRDWRILRSFCHKSRIPIPRTLVAGEEDTAHRGGHWLLKPIHSGGGHGVQRWTGAALDADHVLQEFIPGRPASAAFVSNGRRSVVLALTEQLIGKTELGASGFGWCGNMLPLALPVTRQKGVLCRVRRMADLLTRRFGLVGVNGFDLILTDSFQPHLIEINPRYTGSMELVERAYRLNVYSLHLEAFAGHLPDWDLEEHLDGSWVGKGIVYARQTVTMPQTDSWTAFGRQDIPYPGDRILEGRPVCSVLAEGTDRTDCWNNLVASSHSVRQEIGDDVGGYFLNRPEAGACVNGKAVHTHPDPDLLKRHVGG